MTAEWICLSPTTRWRISCSSIAAADSKKPGSRPTWLTVPTAEPVPAWGWTRRTSTRMVGPVFAKTFAARGLAIGDFNNDGAVDVLISNNDGAPVLLLNNSGSQNHWLGLRLIGRKANSDAIGARITYQAGDLKRERMKIGGGSFLSSHDPRVVLGLGKRSKIDWLEIKWPQPSGAVERLTRLPLDRYITIVEGTGRWE